VIDLQPIDGGVTIIDDMNDGTCPKDGENLPYVRYLPPRGLTPDGGNDDGQDPDVMFSYSILDGANQAGPAIVGIDLMRTVGFENPVDSEDPVWPVFYQEANCDNCHLGLQDQAGLPDAPDLRGPPRTADEVMCELISGVGKDNADGADGPADIGKPYVSVPTVAAPEIADKESLILLKPSGACESPPAGGVACDPHGGGLQLDLSDPIDLGQYNTILRWIEEGAQDTGISCQ
jgi:hypothetical protein